LATDNASHYVRWKGLAMNKQISTALPVAVLQADRW